VEGVAAIFGFRSLQVLEFVDLFYVGQKFVEPLDAALGLAFPGLIDEFGDVVLIEYGDAFEDRDLDLVVAGEQEAFPFLICAFFDGEFEVRMSGANKLRELVEGGELCIFGKDARGIGHRFFSRWKSRLLELSV
jgi:hypothetical protein